MLQEITIVVPVLTITSIQVLPIAIGVGKTRIHLVRSQETTDDEISRMGS